MNLEQIDTSTTAGKAEVMRLAAEGRRVAYSNAGHHEWALAADPRWDWRTRDYAIIAEPVGPEELWVILGRNGAVADVTAVEECIEDASNDRVVRYIRADLAGEKG
ncbi:hypothetical protein [Stenotrophomonas maltophilia]|uniref:hypothetical protein n=1 Tax=Stenotrophomonas maltophilia TaxID=40324 RepID=UPI000B420E13|nr:hypothetical protein [Stenotrophomonas maltophilia]OWB46512.1 hypothetical protein B7H27_10265 [Stenotrophomonas maltophilia]